MHSIQRHLNQGVWGSESKVLGPCLDAFASLDADPGPNLRKPMHQKSPQPLDAGSPQAPSGASEANDSNASNESNESKVGSKAQDFRCIRCMRFGPWSESNESNDSKVGPQGQDFRCIRFSLLGPWSEIECIE